jgi:preprotein translocase subunit SecF
MANDNKAPKQKFFELIKPDHNFEFVGRMNLLLGISLFLVFLSIVMLPVNYFWRGQPLNFGIDFRGGSEVRVQFANDADPAKIRAAMQKGGFGDAEVVKIRDAAKPNTYLLRFGAVSPVSEAKTKELEAGLKSKFGADSLRKFEYSDGGDKIYLHFTKAIEPADIAAEFKSLGVSNNSIQPFGRAEEHTYEVILVGLNVEVRNVLEQHLGAGSVADVPSTASVGAKAGA